MSTSGGVPVPANSAEQRGIVLSQADLACLVAHVSLAVVARRHGHRWWTAELESLQAEHLGQGLEDTLVGLLDAVRVRIKEVFRGEVEEREMLLPVAMRAWLEDSQGRLSAALQEATIIDNVDYDPSPLGADEPHHDVSSSLSLRAG